MNNRNESKSWNDMRKWLTTAFDLRNLHLSDKASRHRSSSCFGHKVSRSFVYSPSLPPFGRPSGRLQYVFAAHYGVTPWESDGTQWALHSFPWNQENSLNTTEGISGAILYLRLAYDTVACWLSKSRRERQTGGISFSLLYFKVKHNFSHSNCEDVASLFLTTNS